MSDSIQVAIRLRPLNEREIKSEKTLAWKTLDHKTIFQTDVKNSEQKYTFDRVYDCEESTLDIYEETVENIVLDGIDGFNGTLFAYGQTSSGKTYTMSGTKSQMGIIPLAIQSIFSKINNSPDREFLLRVSYMEIYNEKISDLLDPEEKILKMMEDENRQIIVNGLQEEVFRCAADVLELKRKGDARRRVAETARNEESSRSHAIFQIIIESQERHETDEELVDESVRLSSLYFVDLAGSEKSSENSGERFREGCAINKSLMVLGLVIGKLSEGVSNQHINYRDSKLTRLLQNGLGGNCKTAIICTINTTAVDESNSTLRFASRAKIIKNKPTINELTDTSDKAILKRYQKEIADLKLQLETFKSQSVRPKGLSRYYNDSLGQEKNELEVKYKNMISEMKSMMCVSTSSNMKKKINRRETWCPGLLKRKLEQSSHLPPIAAIGTPSYVLGNILEETPTTTTTTVCEKTDTLKAPTIFANSSSQTDRPDNVVMQKLEIEMLRNQVAMMSGELNNLKSRPVKQRRVSVETHDETREFLELELQFAQEKNHNSIEKEKQLEMERRVLKEERINHDAAVRAFQAEKKQLMQRVESTEGENACLLTNLERSKERVKSLEQELTFTQNQIAMTSNNRRSMDRPLMNLSNITNRSMRTSCGNCLSLKEQTFTLQSEIQVQETEIQKLTRDLERCKEELKNKFDEVRFLSGETNEQKKNLEILHQENAKVTQILEDKTPIMEYPEVIQLKTRLSEVSQEKESLQQKLKTKSEEFTYLSRQSAVYLEQIESKNISSSTENGKASEEVEVLKTELAAMEGKKSQALRDLNINKLFCNNLKDQLKAKTDECLMLQKNLNATHEEVVAMRNTLVDIKDQLLAKEELILELSQGRLIDVSCQPSLLVNSSSPDQETNYSSHEQLDANSKKCEKLTQKLQDLAEKNVSEDVLDVCTEVENNLSAQMSNVQQEKVLLEEKYNQLMEERDGLERLVAEQAQELCEVKHSINDREKCSEEVELEMRGELDSIKVTLKVKEEECERLDQQLVQVKQECERLDQELVQAKQECEKSDQQLVQAKQECERLDQELVQAKQECERLDQELVQAKQECEGLDQELVPTKQECERLDQELVQAKQECERLDQQLVQAKQECEGLDQQLVPTKQECERLDQELVQAKQECERLDQELVQAKQECDKLAGSNGNDEERRVLVQAESEAQSVEIARLRQQLALAEEDCKQKAEDSSQLHEQVSLLKEKLAQNSEDQDHLKIEDQKSQSEECLEQTEGVTQELKENNIENEDGDDECEIIFQTPENEADITLLDSLREELDTQRVECSRLKEMASVQECEVLKQELKNLKNENENLILACASLREQITELREDKRSSEGLMDSLRKEFEEKSFQYTVISEEMKTLRIENDNKMSACKSLSEKLSNLKQEKTMSEELLESLREEFKSKEEELEGLKKELKDSKKNGDSKCTECERLETELSVIKCRHAQEVAALDNKMDLFSKETNIGKVSGDDRKPDVETASEICVEMNADNAETDKSANMKQELDSLKEELDAKKEECRILSTQLQEMTQKNMQQGSTPAVQDDNEELSLCKHQLEDKIAECCQLQKELANIQDDYQILKMSLADLQDYSQLADSSLQNQLSECQADLESKTQECTSLGEQLSEMEKKICTKTEESNALSVKISKLEEMLGSKTEESNVMNEVSKVEELLSSKTEECRVLNEKISTLEEMLISKTEESSVINEKISKLEELLSCKTEECSALNEKISMLEEMLSSKMEEFGVLNEKISTLEEMLDSKTEESSVINKKISKLEETLSSKTEEYSVLNEKISTLEEMLRSKPDEFVLNEKIFELEELLSSRTKECQSLTQRLEALNAAPTLKSGEESACQLQQDPSTKDLDSVQESVFESTDKKPSTELHEIEQLQEKLNHKTAECESLAKQVHDLKTNPERMEVSIALEMDTKDGLLEEFETETSCTSLVVDKNQLNQSNENVFENSPDKPTLVTELKTKTQECVILSGEIGRLKKELKNLKSLRQSDTQKLQETIQELETKSLDYEILVDNIKRSSSSSSESYGNKELQKEIAERVTELEEANARLRSEVEQEQENLSVVKDELAKSLSELENLNQECDALKEDLIEMTGQTNGLEEALHCAQEQQCLTAQQLDAKSLECDRLAEELSNIQKEYENLNTLLLNMDAENNRLSIIQKDLFTTQNDLDAKVIECSALNGQVESLHAELESIKVSLLNLEAENQQLLASKERMVSMQENLDVQSQDNAKLLEEIADLKDQKQNAQDLIATKEAEVSTICAELESKQTDFAELKERLTTKLSEVETENVGLRESLLKLDEQNDKLSVNKKELESKAEECASLSAELEAAKTLKLEALVEAEMKLESKTEDCLKLSEEISALKEQAVEVEEKFSQELESRLKDYAALSSENESKIKMLEEVKVQLAAKMDECTSLSERVVGLEREQAATATVLQKELAEKSQQCDTLSIELAKILKKHSNVERLLNSKEFSGSETEEKLRSYFEECDALKEKLEAEEEKVKNLTSQLESHNKSLEYKEEVCKFLYESNQSIKMELDQLKDHVASRNNTINDSTMQKSEINQRSLTPTEDLMPSLEKMQEENDFNKSTVLQEKIKIQREKIESLSTENQMKTELIAKLEMKDPTLTNESSESLSKLQNELTEKSEECKDLSEQLRNVKADLMTTKAQLKKIKKEKIELSETMETLEMKADLYEIYAKESKEHRLKLEELEESKLETTKRLIELEAERKSEPTLMNMTEDLTEVTQQLKTALEEKDSHKSVTKKLKKEIIELKEQLEDVSGKAGLCQILQEEIKTQREKIESLSTEVDMKTELITKLEMQDPTLTNESRDSLSKLQKELTEMSQECKDLSEQLRNVKADLTSTKAELNKMKKEKIELSETLETKVDLCEVYAKENNENKLKLKELEESKLTTTRRLTELEAEIEKKPEIGMTTSMNMTEDLTEVTLQLKKALEEKDSHKSVAKKLKIEKLQLKDTLEDLKVKANLCEVLKEEIRNHVNKLESLSSDLTKKDEMITKLQIDVREKQETGRVSTPRVEEFESLQQELSKKSIDLVRAQLDYKMEKAQFEKKINSYEETIEILKEKIKSLKEELRLLQTEQCEMTVKVPSAEQKTSQSSQAKNENPAMRSQGFVDHMVSITLEAENVKLTRKIETLKRKLHNSLNNHEELKKELQIVKETTDKENDTPGKRKKVAEKSTNTEIPKLSDSVLTPVKGKLSDKKTKSPSRNKLQQCTTPLKETKKAECNNQ